MKLKASELRERINSICTHILFDYNGKECGVDPFSEDNFDMWCGDETMNAKNIDEVMQTPFFDGKALQDITDKIENVEL